MSNQWKGSSKSETGKSGIPILTVSGLAEVLALSMLACVITTVCRIEKKWPGMSIPYI